VFHYKYEHDMNWMGGIRKERILPMNQGLAPFKIADLCLPPLMENDVFSAFLENDWAPDNTWIFRR
jgi:hypothetical protein